MSEIYRQEIKYVIHPTDAELLRQRFRLFLRGDDHAGPDGGYRIRSLYFDDMDFSAYHEKLTGIKERSKYRIRCYNDDYSYIKLEKKERNGDLCRKVTQRIDEAAARALIAGDPGALQGELGMEMALRCRQGLHPVILVDYYRYPFTVPGSDTRVTLDTKLSTPLYDLDFFDPTLPAYPVFAQDEALIEVKFSDRPPDYLIDLLHDIPKDRMAVSKYTRCLSFLDEQEDI